jgi:hypothetical protein
VTPIYQDTVISLGERTRVPVWARGLYKNPETPNQKKIHFEDFCSVCNSVGEQPLSLNVLVDWANMAFWAFDGKDVRFEVSSVVDANGKNEPDFGIPEEARVSHCGNLKDLMDLAIASEERHALTTATSVLLPLRVCSRDCLRVGKAMYWDLAKGCRICNVNLELGADLDAHFENDCQARKCTVCHDPFPALTIRKVLEIMFEEGIDCVGGCAARHLASRTPGMLDLMKVCVETCIFRGGL